MATIRENYYLLLDLDPSVEDKAQIEGAISKKQQEWARLRNHPAKGTWAKQCLSQIPKIRRTLDDAELRKAEAEEATRQLHVQQKEQFTELDQALATLASKSFIYEMEIEKLLKQSAFKSFTRQDIEKRIEVPIKKIAAQPEQDDVKPLEASTAKKIEEDLSIVQKSDLYDFLELKPGSTLRTIEGRINDRYKALREKSVKDAFYTATQELLGQCRRIFKDEESRKRYQKTLDLNRFSSLSKLIDIAGLDNEISATEFEHLVSEAATMGLAKKEAITHIKNYATRKRWSIQLPPDGSRIEQAISCGVCNTLNPPKATNCTGCGFPLEINCPDCKTINPSGTAYCSKCGYAIADMPNALPLIRDAKDALAEGNHSKAKLLFGQANNYWKNHPDIVAGRRKIDEDAKEIQAIVEQIEELIRKKQYYQARRIFSQLSKWPGNEYADKHLEKKITDQIDGAEKWLQKAQNASSIAEKEEAFFQAVNLCKDCQAAVDGLATIPTVPPKDLSFSFQDNSVLLSWLAVPSKIPVTYKLIRKARSIPTHAEDGELLTETAQLSFLDKETKAGVLYYYAVFTQRNGKLSARAACTPPVLRIAEIRQLRAIPSDGSISLLWEAPEHTRSIEVWYKKNSVPGRRGDGSQLSSVRKDGAIHEGLANEEQYGYLIVAVYSDNSGKLLYSQGVSIQATATPPPRAVEHLTVKKSAELAELIWEQVPNKVEMYSSTKAFPFQLSEILPYAELGNIGRLIPIHQKGKVTIRLSQHGIRYFMPVTIKGQLAVVGKQVAVCFLEEVKDLKANVNNDKVHLTWSWPKGAEKVEVLYGDPFAIDSGLPFTVSKQDYDREQEGFTIDSSMAGYPEVLIRVRTILERPDSVIEYSQGTELRIKVKKTRIQLAIQKQGLTSLFSKNIKFEVRLEIDGWLEETLQLVVKENNRLISYKDPDRQVLREFSSSDFMGSNAISTICQYRPKNKGVKNLFFSLIPNDPGAKDNLEVQGNGQKITL